MNYTLVYRERENGYNWSVRNSEGLYAAWIGGDTGNTYIRGWTTAEQASDYMEKHLQADCVWAPWPEPKLPIRNVTTAASYKPAHGSYPDAAAAGWAGMGVYQQPLVWPVIPPHDDGSNEEASTVSEALVQAMAQRVFVVRLVNALRRY